MFPVVASAYDWRNAHGKENDAMLDFLRDNRRFADLFNGGGAGECVMD